MNASNACLPAHGVPAGRPPPAAGHGGDLTAHRVLSLLASATETVCALDCGERLVGRSHECDHPDWVRRLPAVTAPRIDVGAPSRIVDRDVRAIVERAASVYTVDAGALASLAPDLVLTQTQCEVCAVSETDVERALAEVSGSRPRVVSMRPDSLADIWRDLRAVASALGVPERGVQLVSRLQRRLAAIAERSAGLPRVRLAFLEWIDPPMSAGNWTPELVSAAGGDEVLGRAGEHADVFPIERLRIADPDVLWIAPCGYDLARTRVELGPLRTWADWPSLRAVREGRVFLGDGNAFFHRPGPRIVESAECLAEALHPTAFRFGHRGSGWQRLDDA